MNLSFPLADKEMIRYEPLPPYLSENWKMV
jgi:hypothetical protein